MAKKVNSHNRSEKKEIKVIACDQFPLFRNLKCNVTPKELRYGTVVPMMVHFSNNFYI
jgi:hypothetical protein